MGPSIINLLLSGMVGGKFTSLEKKVKKEKKTWQIKFIGKISILNSNS